MDTRIGKSIFLLFFFSGFAALVYQIAWQRSLFTLLGSNTESTTIIVTVFMLGLGCGALAGGWLSHACAGRLPTVFALLEAVTGIYGFASLAIIKGVAAFDMTTQAVTVLLAMAVLLPPTLLMGASLPLLTAYLNRRYANAGRSVAALYLCNTLGAAGASFLTVWVLFPHLGLSGTVYGAGTLNLVVGAAAFFLLRRRG